MMNVSAAFEASAGTSASHLSLLVRFSLCALFLFWAAWNIYGQIQLFHQNKLDIHDMPAVVLRILLLSAIIVILVFVK